MSDKYSENMTELLKLLSLIITPGKNGVEWADPDQPTLLVYEKGIVYVNKKMCMKINDPESLA